MSIDKIEATLFGADDRNLKDPGAALEDIKQSPENESSELDNSTQNLITPQNHGKNKVVPDVRSIADKS